MTLGLEMRQFSSLLYVKSLMTCTSSAETPRQDFELMKQLLDYKSISSTISVATFEKLCNHLWYLSEELLVALATFDKSISFGTKRNMANSLKKEAQMKVQPNRVGVRIDNSKIGQKELDD